MSPSNEYPGLISFRMDWFGLLAVQGTWAAWMGWDSGLGKWGQKTGGGETSAELSGQGQGVTVGVAAGTGQNPEMVKKWREGERGGRTEEVRVTVRVFTWTLGKRVIKKNVTKTCWVGKGVGLGKPGRYYHACWASLPTLSKEISWR